MKAAVGTWNALPCDLAGKVLWTKLSLISSYCTMLHNSFAVRPTHRLGSVMWRVFICNAGCSIPRLAKAWCITSRVTWGTAPQRVYARHIGVSKTSPFVSISLPHRTPTLLTDSSTNSITYAIYEGCAIHVYSEIWAAVNGAFVDPSTWLTGNVMARFPTHLTEEEKKLKKRYQKLREKVSFSCNLAT